MKNKPDGLFFNRQFCAEAQNCCDRRGEITCVISPRGLSVKRFGMEVKMKTEQEKKEERYLISETAKLVGVESHVLRYWEEELKLPIRRNELGHRYYTKEDVEQFREIKKLKEQGLQLKAIRTVLTAEGSMQILMPVPEKEVFQMSRKTQESVLSEEIPADAASQSDFPGRQGEQ